MSLHSDGESCKGSTRLSFLRSENLRFRLALPKPEELVCITHSALSEVEGVLVRTKPNKGLLILSIGVLQRAVAVEVDYTLIAAA